MPVSMKHILVPTDFSDCADSAAAVAIKIAQHSGAKLHFFHLAVDHGPAHVPGMTQETESKEIRMARANLHQLTRKAESVGVRAQPQLMLGRGVERIQQYLKPFQIDMLIMGSLGATGIREAMIGSYTQHVIRDCKVPCLVVKHDVSWEVPTTIVFASTFKRESSHAIRQIINFAKHWKASLHLLFINWTYHLIDKNVAHEMMDREMEGVKDLEFTQNIIETNDKEFGINSFADQIDADVVAVANERKGPLNRLLNPNLAEQLINHLSLPVLVVNEEIHI